MANTPKLNLPLVDDNMTADVPLRLNAVANAIDAKVGIASGLATLGADGKVPAGQLNVSAPADASTTVKGITMLEDSVTSSSVTKAATPKSVKTVNDALMSHQADQATLTTKGHVQLSNDTTSTDETKASTPKALKTALSSLATAKNISLNVDGTTGNDSNDGAVATPFKTIQKAIDSLPQVINHNVTIVVVPGTYNETPVVSGFSGKGTLSMNGKSSQVATTTGFRIIGCAAGISVSYFSPNQGLTIIGCTNIIVSDCNIISGQPGYNGISVNNSIATIQFCTLSNRRYGIEAALSIVYSYTNAGTGNVGGLSSTNGSTIGKYGVQPTGTTAEYTFAGGVIR